MAKIKELYKHCLTNNKPILFNNTISPIYPNLLPEVSETFFEFYFANFQKIDRIFATRYGNKEAVLLEDNTTFPSIYNDWILSANSVIVYNIYNLARLWQALLLDYNPLYNVDGKTTTHTHGKVEGLSGSDTSTNQMGAIDTTTNNGKVETSNNIGNTHTTHNDWKAAYDALTNIEADPTYVGPDPNLTVVRKVAQQDDAADAHTDIITTNPVTNTSNISQHTDTKTDNYGKTNNVDYTVEETRAGNIGVTSSQSLIQQSIELAKISFFDTVFNLISKDLTMWES